MLYAGLTNIRDCIAFPKTAGGRPDDRGPGARRRPQQRKEAGVDFVPPKPKTPARPRRAPPPKQ